LWPAVLVKDFERKMFDIGLDLRVIKFTPYKTLHIKNSKSYDSFLQIGAVKVTDVFCVFLEA
jgi:hypothetical protein